jgi:hypothetical protein
LAGFKPAESLFSLRALRVIPEFCFALGAKYPESPSQKDMLSFHKKQKYLCARISFPKEGRAEAKEPSLNLIRGSGMSLNKQKLHHFLPNALASWRKVYPVNTRVLAKPVFLRLPICWLWETFGLWIYETFSMSESSLKRQRGGLW